jgi:hypothetical protein
MADKKISALTASTTPLAGTEVLPIVQSGTTVKVSVSDLTAGRTMSASKLGLGVTSPNLNLEILSEAAYPTLGTASGGLKLSSLNGSYGLFSGVSGATGKSWLQAMRTDSAVAYNIVLNPSGGDTETGAGNLVIGTAAKGIDFSANPSAPGMTSELLNHYEEGTWTPSQGSGLTVVGAFSSNGRYTRVGRLVTVSGTVIGATSIAVSAIGQICDNLPFVKAGASVSTGTALSSSLTTSGVAAAGGAILYSLTALSGGTQILFALTYEVA